MANNMILRLLAAVFVALINVSVACSGPESQQEKPPSAGRATY